MRLFSDVWSDNVTLFERLMEIHSNLPILYYGVNLKGKFSSGIEGALASTINHDFNWKQLSEIILCIFLLMFSKFI